MTRYSYPIRELCTNAWDASRGDFDVYLPSRWSPEFKVRDFGPGLSHRAMIDHYTTIGGTTKDKSNDEVGGLGIGCKSFFAYLIKSDSLGTAGSGSATVRSFHDGHCRTYVMSLAADGRPVCKLLGDEPSEDRSGLEVSFPVRREDHDTFKSRAEEILWSFPPQPRVPALQWATPEVRRSGEGWIEYDPSSVPFHAPSVRMGCVRYEIDLPFLGLDRWPWSNSTILFEAPIGSLSVQASRESLAYDQRTIDTLRRLISQFEQVQAEAAQHLVENEPNYRAACIAWAKSPLDAAVRAHLAHKVLYAGKPLQANWTFQKRGTLRISYHTTGQSVLFYTSSSRNSGDFSIDTHQLEFNPTICIEKRRTRSAEKFALSGIADNTSVMWLRYEDDAALARFFHTFAMTRDDVVDLDAIKLPKLIRRPPQPVMMTVRINSADETIDLTQGGVFCVVHSRRNHRGLTAQTAQFRDHHHREWNDLWDVIRVEQIEDLRIVQLRPSQLEKLQQYPGWRWARDHVIETLEAKIDFTATITKEGARNGGHSYKLDATVKHLKTDPFPEDVRAFAEWTLANKTNVIDENSQRYTRYKAFAGDLAKNPAGFVDNKSEGQRRYAELTDKYPCFDSFVSALYETDPYDRNNGDPQIIEGVATYLHLFNASKGN